MTADVARPPVWVVTLCAAGSVLSMVAGVYFGGQGDLPPAMTGTALFVILGGLAFEMARRRSV